MDKEYVMFIVNEIFGSTKMENEIMKLYENRGN